jgi:hypothetical protein
MMLADDWVLRVVATQTTAGGYESPDRDNGYDPHTSY